METELKDAVRKGVKMPKKHYTKIMMLLISCIMLLTTRMASASESAEEQRQRLQRRYAHIPKLTAEQAYCLFKAGKILIVDAGEPERFKQQHCIGSINISVKFADKIRLNIPKSRLIGVY